MVSTDLDRNSEVGTADSTDFADSRRRVDGLDQLTFLLQDIGLLQGTASQCTEDEHDDEDEDDSKFRNLG